MHYLIYLLQQSYEAGTIIVFIVQMGFRKYRKFARITQLVREEAGIQVNDWLSEFYDGKAKKTESATKGLGMYQRFKQVVWVVLGLRLQAWGRCQGTPFVCPDVPLGANGMSQG